MDVLDRFKRLIECEDDIALRQAYLELEKHVSQVEYHCKNIHCCLALILGELDDEIEDDTSLFLEETELPLEDYMHIRAKFGEEVANKMYYDVKFGKVPLRFVRRYLSKINM